MTRDYEAHHDSFPSQGRLFNLAKKIGMGWDGLRVAPNYIEFNPLSEKRKETNAKLQYFSEASQLN